MKLRITVLIVGILSLTGCGEKYTMESKEGVTLVKNEGGATLGYSPSSGVKIIAKDRYAFKDLNKNGLVDPMKIGACLSMHGQRTWLKK
jgi:beta-glucosidase